MQVTAITIKLKKLKPKDQIKVLVDNINNLIQKL